MPARSSNYPTNSVDFYLTNLFNKLSRRHVSWAWFHAPLNVLKTLFIIYSPIDMNTPQHRKHVRYFIRRLFRNIPFAYPCEMWLTRATELKSILAESSSTPSLASKQNFIWIIKLTFFFLLCLVLWFGHRNCRAIIWVICWRQTALWMNELSWVEKPFGDQ